MTPGAGKSFCNNPLCFTTTSWMFHVFLQNSILWPKLRVATRRLGNLLGTGTELSHRVLFVWGIVFGNSYMNFTAQNHCNVMIGGFFLESHHCSPGVVSESITVM